LIETYLTFGPVGLVSLRGLSTIIPSL